MKKSILLVSLFIMLIPMFGYSLDSIKIAMGYIPNVQFAPYYIAKEKGYFKENDLDVTFDYGMATDIMSLVAKGTVDFGVSDGDQVIIARDQGIPIKVCYTMYVKYPVAIVSFKEKGINDVRSLKGKRIGLPGPYGSNYFGLHILLNSEGLSLDDVDLKYIGYTQIESLIAKRVDASVVFINNEPVVLRDMGKEINLIKAYDITPMASASIIAGDTILDNNPYLTKRFVQAIVKASDYIIKNPKDITCLLKRYIPTLTDENIDINEKVLLASLDLWVDKDTEKYGLGYTTKKDWQDSIDVMYRLGLIKRKIDPDECFTNEFLR